MCFARLLQAICSELLITVRYWPTPTEDLRIDISERSERKTIWKM
jgi:hypothetical protein